MLVVHYMGKVWPLYGKWISTYCRSPLLSHLEIVVRVTTTTRKP